MTDHNVLGGPLESCSTTPLTGWHRDGCCRTAEHDFGRHVVCAEMTGEFLKVVLEDVADNIFNPDPYYQQGGDMVRTGGLGYHIDVNQPQGNRISNMTLLKTGEAIDPARNYVVAGWASVNEDTEGPQIWDVVESHIRKMGTVTVNPDNNSVVVTGA